MQVEHDEMQRIECLTWEISHPCAPTDSYHEEGLDDWGRVRQACGLNQDGVKHLLPFEELVQNADQIATHCMWDEKGDWMNTSGMARWIDRNKEGEGTPRG